MADEPGIELRLCEGWSPQRVFACQHEGSEHHGCNINCESCLVGGGGLGGTLYAATGCAWTGKHWMRPDQSKPHRNALGLVAPLVSGIMMPMPYRRVSFEAAPCATDVGHECFSTGISVCSCKDPPIDLGNKAVCPPGEFAPAALLWNDCEAHYVGWSWASPATDWMRCRLAVPSPNHYQAFSVTVTTDRGDLFQLQSMRRGRDVSPPNFDSHCNCNLMVPCVGIRPSNECAIEPSAPYNAESAGGTRTVWRDLFLTDASIVWATPPDTPTLTPGEEARLHIRNQVGAWLNDQVHAPGGGMIHFDRLVHIGWGGNSVGRIGSYEAYYNHPLTAFPNPPPLVPPDPDFAFAVWPNCRLKNSGCPVTVTAIIWRIAFRLNLVLLHDQGDVGGSGVFGPPIASYVRVSARIHVDFDLRVIAELQGECFAVRSWLDDDDPLRSVPLTIQEQGAPLAGSLPPIVVAPPGSGLPTPADEIIYVDNEGREFDFPWQVKWKGYLGSVSEPAWPTVLAHGEEMFGEDGKYPNCGVLDGQRCCGLAKELSPLTIGPHPTQFGEGAVSPNGLYTGSVQVEFRNFGGACNCVGDWN